METRNRDCRRKTSNPIQRPPNRTIHQETLEEHHGKANILLWLNIILMPSQNASTIISRFRYKFACFYSGYCPTVKEIQNDEVRKIADRLKTNSDKETLTNVLAWQDCRVSYWHERATLPLVFSVSFALALFSFSLLLWNPVIGAIGFVFFIGFAVSTFVIMALLARSRKLPILSGLDSTLAWSLSIDFLLKNRLAICRDYAKLTACFLRDVCPNREIYFAFAFQHAATGVIVGNKLYILDKFLPLATIDKWSEKWKSKKKLKKIHGNSLELVSMDSFLSGTKSTKPDTEKLAVEMTKLLNLKEQTNNANPSSLEILRWKKGSILYEDDEIVNYSLSKLIEKNILNERLNLNQIAKLEVIQDGDDLVFSIMLELNK
jgi:hypothetical protein